MSLNKCTKNHIISCTVPEIWHMTDLIVIFFILGYFLAFYPLPIPPLTSHKIKFFLEKEKKPAHLLHLTIKKYKT